MQNYKSTTLKYLFLTFLKIGATSWGGFMALISVIQKVVVEKDKKLGTEEILEGISLASVLPGPVAFNVVTYVGYKLRGFRGALVSMTGIVLPSFLLMLLLSYFYIRYGNLPSINHFFAGILPAVAAVIIGVSYSMGKKNISDGPQSFIAIAAAITIALSKAYLSTIIVMVISGITGYLIYYKKPKDVIKKTESVGLVNSETRNTLLYVFSTVAACCAVIMILPSILPSEFRASSLLHKKIALTFSGMSLSIFGGGYVIIPAMQQVIVNSMEWLTNKQFADAVAMGQITPGPIFITSTFVGYKVAGFWGALNATISIFLPPGLLMIICSRFFDKIRTSSVISAVFKGLRPAIIGMIAAAAFTIMIGNDLSFKSGLLFFVFLILAIRYNADPVYLIPGAGVIGLLIF